VIGFEGKPIADVQYRQGVGREKSIELLKLHNIKRQTPKEVY